MVQVSSSTLSTNMKKSTVIIPAVAPIKPDPNHLSVVYNSSDISSYFERHPELVMLRVFQIAGEVVMMFFVGMMGMLEGTDDYIDDNSDSTKSDIKLKKSKMKMAGAVRDSMVRMGPTFIKLGQALSSRQDLIGLEGISQLQLLQDAIPSTFSTADAKDIIRQDLGLGNDHVDQLLDTLSLEPVAAASLGQV
jgi:predicted unusual protein kinase regulating ubiquinone biosynthesis (AarF/ABC1/UbiB family)